MQLIDCSTTPGHLVTYSIKIIEIGDTWLIYNIVLVLELLLQLCLHIVDREAPVSGYSKDVLCSWVRVRQSVAVFMVDGPTVKYKLGEGGSGHDIL